MFPRAYFKKNKKKNIEKIKMAVKENVFFH